MSLMGHSRHSRVGKHVSTVIIAMLVAMFA
jgi:hypothetical protein